MIGNKFENALWSTRFIVLISVVLSIISSIILFLLGGWDIIQAIIYKNPLLNNDIETNNELLFNIISSIDLFLIGIVLLIFGFGYTAKFMCQKFSKKNWEVFCTTRSNEKAKEIKSLNATPVFFDNAEKIENILNKTLLPELASECLHHMANEEPVQAIHVGVTEEGDFTYQVQ